MRTSIPFGLGLACLLAACDGRDAPLSTPGSSAGRDPSARTPLTELTRANLLQTDALTAAIATGDVDGDRDVDLVVGGDGSNQLLYNDGQANFAAAPAGRLPALPARTSALALADLNGDAILDLVAGFDSTEGAHFLLGDGRGGFLARGERGPAFVRAIAALDVDGDRDVDLVFACAGAGLPDQLLRNNGIGLFDDAASALPSDTAVTVGVASADLDGDRDPDLVFLDQDGRLRIYQNAGNGVFTDTRANLPVTTTPAAALALGDVDSDQDADLVVAGAGSESLLLNDGRGSFSSAASGSLPADASAASAALLADLDADADLDLVLANHGAPQTALLNDGRGRFTPARDSGLRQQPDQASALAQADLDGNGTGDLVVGISGSGNVLYLKLPAGAFVEASRSGALGPADPALAQGDMDRDGDLDLVLPNLGLILRNDGGGGFAPSTLLAPPTALVRATTPFDADGDGDLDLLLAFDGQSRLLIQTSGGFADETAQRLPERRASTRAALAFDLEGDNDLDLLLANADEPPRVYRNDDGFFHDLTVMAIPFLNGSFTVAAAGDLDGDGDGDVVLGHSAATGPEPVVWLRNERGRLVDPVTLLRDQTAGLALGDLDGDGDVDLAIGTRAIGGTRPQNRLLINDGTGVFALTSLAITDRDARTAALLDVDGDGDLDALFAGRGSAIWLNDGASGFRDASTTELPADGVPCDAAVWLDADRDGDLDLVASQATGLHLVHNLERHLFSPWPARLGAMYRTEFMARVTRAPQGQIALPYIRLGPPEPAFAIPPFGLWRLGAEWLACNSVALPSPSGIAPVDLQIPNERTLAGQHLTQQALIVPGSDWSQWRLTAALSERIVP